MAINTKTYIFEPPSFLGAWDLVISPLILTVASIWVIVVKRWLCVVALWLRPLAEDPFSPRVFGCGHSDWKI